jgi:hypothetical protein
MIQLLYKTPHYPYLWLTVYAESILKAFDELQKTLDKTMDDNTHISVYEISEIKINYYRNDPRKK